MALRNIRRSVNRQATRLLETGGRFNRFDQIRQRHFWSKARFTPDANGFIASGDYDIFQTPAGQSGQGFATQLTLLETNWQGAGRVPDNQNLVIDEIGVSAQVTTAAGVAVVGNEFNSQVYHLLENELLRNTVLAITYLTNTVPLGMCTDFAQASGPHVGFYEPGSPFTDAAPPVSAVPDRRRTFVSNGVPSPALRRRFKVPIMLGHGETFSFTLQVAQGRGPFVARIDPNDAATTPNIDVRVDFWATESFVEKS